MVPPGPFASLLSLVPTHWLLAARPCAWAGMFVWTYLVSQLLTPTPSHGCPSSSAARLLAPDLDPAASRKSGAGDTGDTASSASAHARPRTSTLAARLGLGVHSSSHPNVTHASGLPQSRSQPTLIGRVTADPPCKPAVTPQPGFKTSGAARASASQAGGSSFIHSSPGPSGGGGSGTGSGGSGDCGASGSVAVSLAAAISEALDAGSEKPVVVWGSRSERKQSAISQTPGYNKRAGNRGSLTFEATSLLPPGACAGSGGGLGGMGSHGNSIETLASPVREAAAKGAHSASPYARRLVAQMVLPRVAS
jgi:hypothetical protein